MLPILQLPIFGHVATSTIKFDSRNKTLLVTSWTIQNTFILRRLWVAKFPDIIKIATIFVKTTLKDSKKLKELEIMHWVANYICISWYNKCCWFLVKNADLGEIKRYVRWFICLLDLLQLRWNRAKFYQCRTFAKYFWKRWPFCPPPSLISL